MSAEEHKQSSSTSIDTYSSEESKSLLEQKKSTAIKVVQLTKENAKLKSELRRAISQLQRRHKSLVVCQLDQPTIDCSTSCSMKRPKSSNQPQRKCPKSGLQRQNSNPGPSRPIQTTHRNSSSPDLYSGNPAPLSASSSAVSTTESKRRRSMSDSFSQHDPNALRPQHRQVLSNNPYGALANLNEESDGY